MVFEKRLPNDLAVIAQQLSAYQDSLIKVCPYS